jgi:hypothetical protein
MHPPLRTGAPFWVTVVACALVLGVVGSAPAQGTSGPVVSDSKVGYIDDAIPGNVLHFRFDAASNNQRPSRGEFFYAPSGPGSRGLPLPEPRVDYRDLSVFAEMKVLPRLSVFADVPVRFLNPEVNHDAAGVADLDAGFKFALLMEPERVLTFQLRTYAPTGDAHRGLGTGHTSLEPGLLLFQPLNERTRLEGELRYWVPVGGGDFAGSAFRYGMGVSRDIFEGGTWRVAPVAEFVGWTFLSGKESFLDPSGQARVQGAAGDTIVNAKLGLRVGVGQRLDFYGGWGRPVTGDRWYENVYRIEMRIRY